MGGDSSKVVVLICNDPDNKASEGCGWTADPPSSNSPPSSMSLKQLACMYHRFDPAFGGLGFWAVVPTLEDLDAKLGNVALAKALHHSLRHIDCTGQVCAVKSCTAATAPAGQECDAECYACGGSCVQDPSPTCLSESCTCNKIDQLEHKTTCYCEA